MTTNNINKTETTISTENLDRIKAYAKMVETLEFLSGKCEDVDFYATKGYSMAASDFVLDTGIDLAHKLDLFKPTKEEFEAAGHGDLWEYYQEILVDSSSPEDEELVTLVMTKAEAEVVTDGLVDFIDDLADPEYFNMDDPEEKADYEQEKAKRDVVRKVLDRI